jgi:hypothetical protein
MVYIYYIWYAYTIYSKNIHTYILYMVYIDLYLHDSSGVYICKSVVNDLKHGNYICKPEVIHLTYEHRIEIPVEFTYVNQ